MELKELNEMDKTEQDRVNNLIKKHKSDKKIDINIFYDDFNLDGPYTSYNPISSVDLKPFQLVPFFKNIIIDIKPFKNKNEFEKYYGMSVERLVDLKGQGLFKFRLTNNYSEYYGLENDYLDLILYNNPPISNVVNRAHGLLINNNDDSLLDIFNIIGDDEFNFGNLLNLDLGVSDPMVLSAMDMMAAFGDKTKCGDDFEYKKVAVNNFINLWACGYNKINDFFKILLQIGQGRLDWVFLFSNVYANFFSNPVLESLNGTHMINSKLKYWADDLSILKLDKIFENPNIPDGFEKADQTFLNSDVAKIMNETMPMNTLLNDYDLDDYDFTGAIDALNSLEKIVDNKREKDIVDASIELKNQLSLASDIAGNMQENKSFSYDTVNKISLGFSYIGTLGSFAGGSEYSLLSTISSVISTALSTLSSTNLFNTLYDGINKLNKENHICYIYDNYDKLNFSIAERIYDVGADRNFLIFNDNLTNKYHYYEYLYKNIPSLKVLIDINAQNTIAEGYGVKVDNPIMNYELNKFIKEISLNSKLKLLLQHYFLYGVGYFINDFKSDGAFKDVNVINPHYVRTINKNGKKYFKVNLNGIETVYGNDKISSFEGCSLVEKSLPIFDSFYYDITKKSDRPSLYYDVILNNRDWCEKNPFKIDESIKVTKESLELCNKLNNKSHKILLLFQLGMLYQIREDYELSLDYFEDSLEVLNQCQSDNLIGYHNKIQTQIDKVSKLI